MKIQSRLKPQNLKEALKLAQDMQNVVAMNKNVMRRVDISDERRERVIADNNRYVEYINKVTRLAKLNVTKTAFNVIYLHMFEGISFKDLVIESFSERQIRNIYYKNLIRLENIVIDEAFEKEQMCTNRSNKNTNEVI